MASLCLATSIFVRMVTFVWVDRHPINHMATAYRVIIMLASAFMFIRSLPVTSILLFDQNPQVLTTLTRVNFLSIWIGLPIVAVFAFMVEFTKTPILGRLVIPPLELQYPTKDQVKKEALITALCLLLATLVVLGKG